MAVSNRAARITALLVTLGLGLVTIGVWAVGGSVSKVDGSGKPRRLLFYEEGDGLEWVENTYEQDGVEYTYWTEEYNADSDDTLILDLLAILIFFVLPVCGCCGAYYYWSAFISSTHDLVVPMNVLVDKHFTDEDAEAKKKYSLFNCMANKSVFFRFLCCPTCAASELQYRNGVLHKLYGEGSTSVAGWQWGAFLHWVTLLAPCCIAPWLPWYMAKWTGGESDMPVAQGEETAKDKITFSQRFGLKGSYAEHLCSWIFCFPCKGASELRRVTDFLDQPSLEVEMAPDAASKV
mmetsp:Transcript_59939/g.126897  ORF Transcript_59939/g.126897 Transcript_59939/m.126897 type:complete len:292 (+) Transcript_59939:232-1107(+)|eukprot:CAMPEP_0206460406 /NCGR_PEP_ID=MMETSP0324_2-20121206/24734_1 /ASSEMBLY_ACC=CAM_ASM_000836 /TAXON_ID=2866 /ORGANISM="Crypthecodinium cohnii, Strain Seligo" /LENGTH=291 /DNA_ID=CAMNT_0053932105 /DNA_START=226 /DNA_END=1101 /DNA_ORIENTATION=+